MSSIRQELKAGTAKADITPKESLPMTRGSGRHMPDLNKSHTGLYAKALALNDGKERFIIVTYNLSALSYSTRLLRKRCQEELGIDAGHLALLADHAHHAPLLTLKTNRPYAEWLADRMFDIIKEAMSKEEPARVYFGLGHISIAANTDSPEDGVTNEVQVLKVEGKDKVPAVLFNYTAQHVGWGWTAPGYGYDFPGFATDEVEKNIPGVTAMFGQACSADHLIVKPEGCDDALECAKIRGRELGQEALRVLSGKMEEVTGQISGKLEIIRLPVSGPIPQEEAKRRLKEMVEKKDWTGCFTRIWLDSVLEHYRSGKPFPAFFPEEVLITRIGSLSFIALQGEVYSAMGKRITSLLRQRNMQVMVFGYFGEHEVYIPSREALGGKPSMEISGIGAFPCGWAPEVEDEFVKGVVDAVVSPEKAGQKLDMALNVGEWLDRYYAPHPVSEEEALKLVLTGKGKTL